MSLLDNIKEFYKLYYPPGPCVCDGQWPAWTVELDGMQVQGVCKACEWQSKKAKMQKLLVINRLSMSIPRGTEYDRFMFQVRRKYDWGASPLRAEPVVLHTELDSLVDVVHSLSCEHVVVYLSKTMALSRYYDDKNGVMDAVSKSPMLVYARNRDTRDDEWMRHMIEGRQYGLAIVNQQPS